MKVKDIVEQEIDVDVYDDVCEELCIAFCGPVRLTEEGEKKFGDVMEYAVKFYGDIAIVSCGAADDGWENRLKKAQEFFEAAAGYCAVNDYEKWFDD